VAVYALLRFILDVFGVDFSLGDMPLNVLLIVLGSAGILIASLVAVYQENVKRMLAYSSVAQVGYMVLGIGLASAAGVSAAIMHLFNHALMKGALFLALGAVAYQLGRVGLRDFAGLGRSMPWTMAAIVIGGLSLIGVPGTAGFISKWYLVLAILEQGLWPLAVLVLIGSILALLYIWRLVEAAYFQRPDENAVVPGEAPLSLLIPLWVLAAANIYFGLFTELNVGLAEQAASQLLEGLP
jgi:multicomponent Na+:H+ antiporter subunit D